MNWGCFDLETDGFLHKVSQTFCMVIRDEHQVMSFTDDERFDVAGTIEEGMEHLKTYDTLVGHNIQGYDIPVMKKLYGWETPKHIAVRDTLILSRLIWSDLKERDHKRRAKDPSFPKELIGKHKLEAWGHRLRQHKGGCDVSNLTELTQEVLDYCVQDTNVNVDLWKLQCKRMPELLGVPA